MKEFSLARVELRAKDKERAGQIPACSEKMFAAKTV
jgi:hypothetical protein